MSQGFARVNHYICLVEFKIYYRLSNRYSKTTLLLWTLRQNAHNQLSILFILI